MERNERGRVFIDGSELMRVYGEDICVFERAAPRSKSSEESQPNQSVEHEQGVQAELNSAQQLLDVEIRERTRERERMQTEIDRLEDILQRSEERHNKITLRLEDRTRGIGEWEKSFQELQNKVDDQGEELLKECERLRNLAKQYKTAYQSEKSKSPWKKLFG